MTDEMNLNSEDFDVSSVEESFDIVETTLENFLDTASVDRVYGDPIQHGDSTIIPTAEVLTGLGFGVGYGMGSAPAAKKDEEGNQEDQAEQNQAGGTSYGGGGGGGGGGRTLARPVAVIIASPEGVRVEPVVDVTKVALAALTAFGFMTGMIARMMSGRNLGE